jgi:MtrB/PioB family decaheme-associated outer membrane protein
MRFTLFPITVILGLITSFGICEPVHSEEDKLEGAISATGKVSDVKGSKAKYHEYSDDKSGGVFGDVEANYDSPRYHMEFKATDPGYDTQHGRIEGNLYDKFKYWLDYNEIIHNITTGARSFYNGAGSETLSGTAGTNSNTWPSTFDYHTKRKRFGTGIDLKLVKPFFFDASYNHEKKEGTRPTSTQLGSTAGNFFSEIPEPVDYRTDNMKFEGGYARKPFFFSVSYNYSRFRNENSDISFTNELGLFPSDNGQGGHLFSLPADSKMHKFTFQGNVKLPMNSKLNVNLGDTRTRSETNSFTTFKGKVDTKNYDLTFTTNPLRFLEGKVYYKYYDRDNKSHSGPIVDVFDSTLPYETFVTNPISYTKSTFGGDLGFRLPAQFHLSAGYKNVKTRRNFVDEIDPGSINLADVLPHTTDNIFNVDLKWSGLDFMSAWIGYERLARGTTYQTIESRNLIFRNYSYAAQDRHTFKTGIDLSPTDDLNLSFEYDYKRSIYNDILFGVKDDTSNAISFSGDYAFRKLLRFSTYFDAEKATLDQLATTSATTRSPQWKSKLEEINYGYGAKAEIFAIPKKLTFSLQGNYMRNHGTNDFDFYGTTAQFLTAFQLPAGGGSLPVDIPNVDSYQQYSLRFITTYYWSNTITIKAGYAYDRYKYSDAQLNGYQYIVTLPTAGSPVTGYLGGAYANPSYSVNTVFLALTYRF